MEEDDLIDNAIISSDESDDDYMQEVKRPGGMPPRIALAVSSEECMRWKERQDRWFQNNCKLARMKAREQRSMKQKKLEKEKDKKKKKKKEEEKSENEDADSYDDDQGDEDGNGKDEYDNENNNHGNQEAIATY